MSNFRSYQTETNTNSYIQHERKNCCSINDIVMEGLKYLKVKYENK